MFYSLFFALAFGLFSQPIFAQTNNTEPGTEGYTQLRHYLERNYGIPFGKKCFQTVTIPTRNCHVEIYPAPNCEKDWAWDEIYIKFEAGAQRVTLNAVANYTSASEAGSEFIYHQYDLESEEGHKTGPMFLKDMLTVTDKKITLSTYVNDPDPTRTVSCDL